MAENIFCVPADARWQKLPERAKRPDLGQTIVFVAVFQVGVLLLAEGVVLRLEGVALNRCQGTSSPDTSLGQSVGSNFLQRHDHQFPEQAVLILGGHEQRRHGGPGLGADPV